MANAEVSTSAPESQPSKRPPDAVAPPLTPPVDVESHNDSALNGQEERREEDCHVGGSESENKIPLHSGSGILSEGKAIFGDDSSFGKDLLGEEPMRDSHITKLETVKEEQDLPAVKLDTSTPEQPMQECQAVKSCSERKRKSHDGSKNMESLFERTDRRLTRSNSRIITKGRNNCQKVAKRLTRSHKSSSADYLGNDVDILGLERALKRLSRTGSKRVLQEPAGDDGLPNSPTEETSDCVMSDAPDSDGSSDVANRGVTIIEGIVETIRENETQPIYVAAPVPELGYLGHPSDELESNSVSTEADETIEVIKEDHAVCANEETVLFVEFTRDEPLPENKGDKQTTVLPMEVCPTAVEVSSDGDKFENSRLETPPKRLTRSALRNAQVESTGFSGFVSSTHETKNAEQNTVLPIEACSTAVGVSSDGHKLENSRLETPSKRLTRSALRNAQVESTAFSGFVSSTHETKNAKQSTVLPIEVCSTAVEMSSDGDKLENSRLETPSKRLMRSALKNAQVELTGFSGFVSSTHETKDAKQSTVPPMVCSSAVEMSTDENKLDNSRLETPSNRLTGSALKSEQLDVNRFSDPGSSMDDSMVKHEDMEVQEIVVAEEPNPNPVDKSTDVVKIEKCGLDMPSKRLTRSALKNAQMDVTPFLGFKSTIDEPRSEMQDANKLEVTQVSVDGSGCSKGIKSENSEFETPLKRITRSAVKSAQVTSSESELPPRRFTRSLLKCNISYDEEDGAEVSVEMSELERATRNVSCSSQKGNKKANRATISGGCKKFDLIKPPSNARELLASGFLEGLDVMYIVPHSKVI
jgi:hypothetical protein